MVTNRRMDIDVFERELLEAKSFIDKEIENEDREHDVEYYEGMKDGIKIATELIAQLAHELN